MKKPRWGSSQNDKNPKRFFNLKQILILVLMIVFSLSLAKNIEIKDFSYDDNLIGLEPIFTQKAKITSIDQDSSGQLFLNIADGSRIKFLGIRFSYSDQAKAFLEKHMLDNLVYLSYEADSDDSLGFKNAYVWTDEIYKYYSVSILWNAVLIINGLALPMDYDYTYNEIFFALESKELEIIGSQVEDIKTTREIEKTITEQIPAGFEVINWDMKKSEIWYRINKQLIEERDDRLKYIAQLYGESCLLYYFFDDKASLTSVSYVFGFTDTQYAEKTYERFLKNLKKIFGDASLIDSNAFKKTDGNKIESYYIWKGTNAKAEIRIGTISKNTHAMVLKFEKLKKDELQ